VVPDTHCLGVLRRHDGLFTKRDVRILLLGPPRKHLTVFGSVTCANLHSYWEEPVAEPLVIKKMDLCGLVQGRPYDLTGICSLMIKNWISLHHGVKCGGCEIH